MSEKAPYNEIDDYIATFSVEEARELEAASAAIDLAFLMHQAREESGLTQAAVAAVAGLQQQAVSRLERAGGNMQLSTVQRYFEALGFEVNLIVTEKKTGRVLGNTSLPPIPRTITRSMPYRRGGTRRMGAS